MSIALPDIYRAVSTGSPTAPALAFGTGVISSIGPCLTTRAAVLRGLLAQRTGSARAMLAGAFVAGLLCAFGLIGTSASLWYRIAHASEFLYATLAGVLVLAGASAIAARASGIECRVKRRIRACAGGAFVSGAALGLLASPCCAPAIASIAGLAALNASHGIGIASVFCFGTGNAAPLVAAAAFDAPRLQRGAYREAAAIVNAGVLLSLGAYYAVLA
ncbi:MAG: cytochrome c biogenesis protein CcdA [Candidatus Tyrphobacter sp.]